ncbi:MAG: ATP-binding cassette domain-containing protein [Oscillospiraceae bacterium]|nr:ATP-binding cassette domain-containing protein [Oscillospiraceae bacterium]
MIQCRALEKHFGDFTALRSLDLAVPRGAVYGLVGPNGAGKTTVIRHLAGVYRPEKGEVSVCGEAVFENPAVKARIAFIPDEVFFHASDSISDMARFYASLCPRFSFERYETLRGAFRLDDTRPMRRLSRGMQKQAAFWLALSQCPEVLILDEPVDGLDPVMRRAVWGLILADVAERGTTVLVSSHNLRELEDVCDHVGIMNNGKMLLEHTLTELQDNIVKIQLAYADGGDVPEGLEILHESAMGRLRTLILRGKSDELQQKLAATQPLFLDVLPLTLEEIFIYELGGAGHALSDMVL